MRKFSIRYKFLAIALALAFTFQSLESINGHTYSIGVDNYHYHCGCFGCYPTHLAATCESQRHHSFY